MNATKGRGGFRLIRDLTMSRPRQLLVIAFLAFLGALASAPGPYLGKVVIDDIILRHMAPTGAGDFQWFPEQAWMILGLVGLGLLLRILNAMIVGWQSHYILLITRNSLHDLRMDTAERVMGAQQRWFETTGPGLISARLGPDSAAMDSTVFNLLRGGLGAVFTVAVVLVFMLVINAKLALIVMVFLPLTALVSVVPHRRAIISSRAESDRWAGISAATAEIFSSMKLIRTANAQERFLARIGQHSEDIRVAGERHFTVLYTVNGLLWLLAGMGADIFLVVGGIMALQGHLTFGEFFAFSGYQSLLWMPLSTLVTMGQTVQQGVASADRTLELLEVEQEPHLARPAAAARPGLAGEVRAERLCFSYDGLEDVLKDVDLFIQPGTMTALVGHSGSGKTTFASVLLGLYPPTGGRLYVDGVDVRQWDLRQLRRRVGVVMQESVLFDDTIRGNLLLGQDDFDEARLWSALRAASLEDDVRAMPQGLDTRLGQQGVRLSGGQRQRLAIARVFLRDPRLVILDEATSALDVETERQIQGSFDALLQGRTAIVIAHRLSTILRADRIVVLSHGRVVETGTHAELIGLQEGHYRRLYQVQVDDAPEEGML